MVHTLLSRRLTFASNARRRATSGCVFSVFVNVDMFLCFGVFKVICFGFEPVLELSDSKMPLPYVQLLLGNI